MRVVFVHGACVRDGAWWWQPTGDLLARQGVTSVAPALPSCGEAGAPAGLGGPGYAEDVAAVRAELTSSQEPTVVVVHSYGGIVAAEAAAGVEAVTHVLLIASYLPVVGQSLSSFAGTEPAAFLDVDEQTGTFGARPELFVGTFLQDCPQVADDALTRLARQSLAVTTAPVQAAASLSVPSTYLVCAQDRGTPARMQRDFATRADAVVEIDAGHHPFLSQPQAVANLVMDVARA